MDNHQAREHLQVHLTLNNFTRSNRRLLPCSQLQTEHVRLFRDSKPYGLIQEYTLDHIGDSYYDLKYVYS